MNWKKATLLAPFLSYAGRLRFPWLFTITLTLFVVNVLVPDIIPFADEALLGLGALLLGSLKNRRKDTVADLPGGKDGSDSGAKPN